MNENINKFCEALQKDEAMQNRAAALFAKYKDCVRPDENTVAAEIAAFAKNEGLGFTQAEWLEYSKTVVRELCDNELAAVAGGGPEAYSNRTYFTDKVYIEWTPAPDIYPSPPGEFPGGGRAGQITATIKFG